MEGSRNRPDRTFEVLLLGSEKTGKTTLARTYGDQYRADSGVYVSSPYRVAGYNITLEIREVSAQASPSELEALIRSANGAILVFSIIDRESFIQVQRYTEQIRRVRNISKFPMVLVGTNADLEFLRVVSFEEKYDFANQFSIQACEINALLDRRVAAVFIIMTLELINYKNRRWHHNIFRRCVIS